MIGIRLQGGPCDGERASLAEVERDSWSDPARIWARSCAMHGADWADEPIDGWQLYRRDDEDGCGWLIYVSTDEELEQHCSIIETVTGAAS